MTKKTYPFFKRGCFIAFLLWVLSIAIWRSFVLSFCLAALPFLITIVWRKKELPALPFALTIQWMQVSLGIIWRDIFGAQLSAVAHPNVNLACYLGIIGLIVLGLGLRFGFLLSRWIFMVRPVEEPEETNYSIGKVFSLYLVLLFLAPVICTLSWNFMQIRSIMMSIVALNRFVIFLLFYLAIIYNRAIFIIVTLAFEIIYGMTGYFSGYKTSLLIFAIVAVAFFHKLTLRMRYILLSIYLLLFVLSVAWQAIKPELRKAFDSGYLAQTGQIREKMKFVYDLGENILREDDFNIRENMVYALIERMSSVYFFAHTLEMVPLRVPHEGGRLFNNALKHVFTPRLLFPDKEGLPPDTWMVRTYAGAEISEEDPHTSIALGYLVENYIDFGIPYMFIPVFVIGVIAAIMYRYIFKIAVNSMLANTLSASIFFFNLYLFEKANIKLFGNLLTDYIVFVVALLLFQKRFLKFITKKDHRKVV